MSNRLSRAGKGLTFEELVVQLHAPAAKNPHSWFWKGASLRHASDVLWNKFWRTWKVVSDSHIEDEEELSPKQRLDLKLGAVWRLMTGLAIEAFFKGIILYRDPNTWKDVTRSHDLANLYAMTGIDVDGKVSHLLTVLSASIVWEGRYPVPKKASKMKVFFPPDKNDLRLANTLFEEIAEVYSTILHTPHRS